MIAKVVILFRTDEKLSISSSASSIGSISSSKKNKNNEYDVLRLNKLEQFSTFSGDTHFYLPDILEINRNYDLMDLTNTNVLEEKMVRQIKSSSMFETSPQNKSREERKLILEKNARKLIDKVFIPKTKLNISSSYFTTNANFYIVSKNIEDIDIDLDYDPIKDAKNEDYSSSYFYKRDKTDLRYQESEEYIKRIERKLRNKEYVSEDDKRRFYKYSRTKPTSKVTIRVFVSLMKNKPTLQNMAINMCNKNYKEIKKNAYETFGDLFGAISVDYTDDDLENKRREQKRYIERFDNYNAKINTYKGQIDAINRKIRTEHDETIFKTIISWINKVYPPNNPLHITVSNTTYMTQKQKLYQLNKTTQLNELKPEYLQSNLDKAWASIPNRTAEDNRQVDIFRLTIEREVKKIEEYRQMKNKLKNEIDYYSNEITKLREPISNLNKEIIEIETNINERKKKEALKASQGQGQGQGQEKGQGQGQAPTTDDKNDNINRRLIQAFREK